MAGFCLVRAVDQRVLERLVRRGRLRVTLAFGLGFSLVRGASERLVTGCAQALGNGVQRRAGDHEQAEEHDQHQQRRHDVRALQEVDEDRREQEADRSAGLADGRHVVGSGHAVREVHESEHATADGRPADDLTPGRTVAVGVAQGAPGDDGEQDRHGPRQQPDAPRGRIADAFSDDSGDLPPHRRRHDDAQAEHPEADAVTALLRFQLAGRVADAARHGADRSGQAEPDGSNQTEDAVEQHGDGTRTGSSRAALGGLALLLRRLTLRGRLLLAGLAAGRPLARRGRRSGRHGESLKEKSSLGPLPRRRRGVRLRESPAHER